MEKQNQKGLIKEILIIIVVLIILGYFFNININNVLSSATVQANLAWLWNIFVYIWSLISAPVMYLWNIFVGILKSTSNSAAINAVNSAATSTL